MIADIVTEISSSSDLTADEIAEDIITQQAINNTEGFTLPGMKYNFTQGSNVSASGT